MAELAELVARPALRVAADGEALGLDVDLLAAAQALHHLGQRALQLLCLALEFEDPAAQRAGQPPGGEDHRDDRDQADGGGQGDLDEQGDDGRLADLHHARRPGLHQLHQLRVDLVDGLAPLVLERRQLHVARAVGVGGAHQRLLDGGLGLPGVAVDHRLVGRRLGGGQVRADLRAEEERLVADGLLDELEVLRAQLAGLPAAGEDGVLAGEHLLGPERVDQHPGDVRHLTVVDVAERGEQREVHRDEVGVVGEHGLLVGRPPVHRGALPGELGHRLTGLEHRGAHLGGGVGGDILGEGLEDPDGFVRLLPLLAQGGGGGGRGGDRLGAEPALLLEVVVHDVGRLAGLLGQQTLAGLPLEVEDGLAAGHRPECGERDARHHREDEERRSQGQAWGSLAGSTAAGTRRLRGRPLTR